MPLYISPPPQNPFMALLAAIVGVVALVGVFMLGFVALVVVLGVGAVLWLGFIIRFKWIQRKLRKQGLDPEPGGRINPDVVLHREESLEAEYTVISTEKDD